MFTLQALAAAYAVPHDTLYQWANLGRMGRKQGHSRIYDDVEAFALGLLCAVRAAGQPVGFTIIDSALAIAASRDRPAAWTVAESDCAAFVVDIAAATKIINEQLGVIA